MNRERYERLQSVFHRAIDLEGDDRDAYLDEVCEGDDDLRRNVELLLRQDDGTDRAPHLDRVEAMVAGAVGAAPEAIPERIGKYRILEQIGEGGMGRVYLAEQEDPRRRVALKVIRPELLSPGLALRFRREVEVLGKLQHPGIAQIHEAGKLDTPAGPLPYFAMEYVDGIELRDYVKRRALGVREKLELAARICDAAHHAHLNGIVHRDLKPDNILVVDETSRSVAGEAAEWARLGRPKVLDFGIARVTDSDIQVTTLQTDAGKLVGTLAYMSPEQVAGDSRLIDMRSDIYGLGCILYELLAGKPPFGLADKPIPEAARIIREEDPPRLGSVDTEFRGDIDTMATKALEKERERRYASAADLAADIRRHLASEPITAHPPSAFYELKKFARRHRGLVLGLLLSFLILLAGLAVSLSLMVVSKRNEEAARRSEEAATRNASLLKITTSQALGDTDPVHAMSHLEAVPAAFRNWEWHHQNGRLACHLCEHSGDPSARSPDNLACRPDGTIVAALNRGGDVEVIDVSTGEVLSRIRAPSVLETLAISQNGSLLATWSRKEETLSVWDVDRELRIGTMFLAGDSPGCRIAPGSGRLVYYGAPHEMLYVVDGFGDDGTALAPHPLRESRYLPGFDATGERLAVPLYMLMDVWSAAGRRLAYIKTNRDGSALVYSADGSRIALGSSEHLITILDASTLDVQMILRGHSATVSALAFSPDGSRLASASGDGTARVWDLSNGQTVRTLLSLPGRSPSSLVFSRDGLLLAAADAEKVRLWKWREDSRQVCRGHEDYVYQIDFSPEGTFLASAAFKGEIRLWNPVTCDCLAVIPKEFYRRNLGFNTDGSRLVVSDYFPGSSRREYGFALLDPAAGRFLTTPRRPEDEWIARPVPHGTDAHRFNRRIRFYGGSAGENTDCNREGTLSASVCEKKRIELHDPATGELIGRIGRHASPLWSVALSPDSSRIASGDADGLVKIWDGTSGSELAALRGHFGRVYSIAFSPDGSRIATGGVDSTILLWDAATFERVAALSEHDSYVHSLRFSPDGTRLASGSGDGTVRIWDSRLPSERWSQRLRAQELETDAALLLERLFRELRDPFDVADRLRGDDSLDAEMKKAVLRLMLRRSAIGISEHASR